MAHHEGHGVGAHAERNTQTRNGPRPKCAEIDAGCVPACSPLPTPLPSPVACRCTESQHGVVQFCFGKQNYFVLCPAGRSALKRVATTFASCPSELTQLKTRVRRCCSPTCRVHHHAPHRCMCHRDHPPQQLLQLLCAARGQSRVISSTFITICASNIPYALAGLMRDLPLKACHLSTRRTFRQARYFTYSTRACGTFAHQKRATTSPSTKRSKQWQRTRRQRGPQYETLTPANLLVYIGPGQIFVTDPPDIDICYSQAPMRNLQIFVSSTNPYIFKTKFTNIWPAPMYT